MRSSLRVLLLALMLSACNGERPRNVILVIADGCGPATYTIGQEFAEIEGRDPLVFRAIEAGSVITRSADSRVTDSAAGATAYACGVRTDNGMIAVRPDSTPVPTLLERAEEAGRYTGLVSTARLSHATPASFASHVPDRNMEADIASQMMEQEIEVLLGGGRQYFVPRSDGGSRDDDRNLIDEAVETGYTVIESAVELPRSLDLPLLGLFSASHMPYDIDRPSRGGPSLADMTRHALLLLDRAPRGFFLMIEAGRIDHAGHANDIAAHLYDLLAYDEAMKVALEYAERDGGTLVVATSDHETGGLSLGRDGVYAYDPAAAGGIRASIDELQAGVERLASEVDDDANLVDAIAITLASNGVDVDGDREGLVQAIEAGRASDDPVQGTGSSVADWLRRATARQAGVLWASDGHTGVNVPLFASGPGSERFRGTLDNHVVGQRLAEVMGLSVDDR